MSLKQISSRTSPQGTALLFLTGMCEYKSKEMGPFETEVNEMNGTLFIQNQISWAIPCLVYNRAMII